MTSQTNPEGEPKPVEVASPGENAATEDAGNNNNKSALQDNIERKGKNAYYFAHSHRAKGPEWDGKAEPRLLSSTTGTAAESSKPLLKKSTFDYHKSNITSYAFLDEPNKIKIYVELKDVGEQCADEDIVLEWAEQSFCLTVNKYQSTSDNNTTTPCLCFSRLTGKISGASFKKKEHKLIVTLQKVDVDVVWHTINDKGTPDHEVV